MNKRDIGSFYEEMAVEYLKRNDFSIIEQNYCCKVGEIDIVATKQHVIHFVEVKYRKDLSHGFPVESVSKRKQKKLFRAAQWYLAERMMSQENVYCFDVISIVGVNVTFYENCFGGM